MCQKFLWASTSESCHRHRCVPTNQPRCWHFVGRDPAEHSTVCGGSWKVHFLSSNKNTSQMLRPDLIVGALGCTTIHGYKYKAFPISQKQCHESIYIFVGIFWVKWQAFDDEGPHSHRNTWWLDPESWNLEGFQWSPFLPRDAGCHLVGKKQKSGKKKPLPLLSE